ncbi:hypothetical protein QWZ02_02445 [Kinneretia asaccharophila]|uniref:Uncharacterized protein n=1 Tax=Roseateles asaccharophilus TaxID=582607 RepID=A0A4R6NFG2_9BURK|nr:hypothetical protein [Roseateles asaccharophilus]MDN3543307.1 hypothetical protein [Roseateles asaccharophilus]TDP12994.1 hypothetical protein DFR39_101468 [Roseateles asaccharophilus]
MNKPSPLRRLLSLRAPSPAPAPAGPVDDLAQARALIAAIDAGGIPLYPGKVNQIARALGLEVSREAPVEETVARIRAHLQAEGG